ncbi:hypothetical protein ABER02_08625 [Rossellomorea marisflavi]|uniref:hypothetical protein n=1 Tax=Rossellomorea marisflavi TaxID=189381 RepID=UPI0013181B6E|nr:hypothetical protein [Rossellomorea marisflavi]QHA37535.1 hypothetical protein D5E69_18235 [Rossellomorea marisflavi]
MQRRTADSFGNRGKVETLQPKRLNLLPEESGRPQRNATILSLLLTIKKWPGFLAETLLA